MRGHAEEVAQFGGPGEGGRIEQESAAGVGGVGGVGAPGGSAGEVPEDPGVDGAEGEVRVGRRQREVALAQEPGGLGRAEVGVEDETGRGAHERQVAGVGQLGAQRRGPAILPDDRPVQRPARRAVERHQGLALVGDADGRDGLARLGKAAPDLGQGGQDGGPDLGRVVLDPARPGEVLGQLPVGDVGHSGVLVDHEGADAGRARIDGDDLGHWGLTLTVRG